MRYVVIGLIWVVSRQLVCRLAVELVLWGGSGSDTEVKGERTWELVGMNLTVDVKYRSN